MVRVPQYPHDRGYAASREQAMADFKAAWERGPRSSNPRLTIFVGPICWRGIILSQISITYLFEI